MYDLSSAETKVADLAASGMSDKQIAESRDVSPRTIANQMRSVYRKLGVANRVELVRKLRANLAPPDPTA